MRRQKQKFSAEQIVALSKVILRRAGKCDAQRGGVGTRRETVKLLLVACTFLSVLVSSTLAQNTVELNQLSSNPNTPSVQSYGEHEKLCLAWTDGCVICNPSGCSNIGIACQPKEITCTDRQTRAHELEIPDLADKARTR